MGAFLDKPITEKEYHVGAGNGVEWAVAHMQGWRVSMEDAHCAQVGLPGAADYSFFGVFDGHGGSMVAQHCANHLIDAITSRPEFKQGLEAGPKGLDRLQEAMRMGSLALDAEMRSLPAIKSNEDHSGTTAVFALVTPTHLIVGNIGDSRCVMSRAGKAVAMSYDHKPTNPPEQARIEAANGTVTLSRVNGDLAVSRALGDYSYKQMAHLPAEAQQVSAEPEFQVQERTSDDQFLILCCDGIWDVMTNDDVVSFYIQKEQGGGNLKQSCGDLLDSCLDRKSRDNMTTLGVRLGGKL